MPHFFVRTNTDSPNPGRWTHDRVHEVAQRHNGSLEHLWHDDPDNPQVAYMLIRDGDLEGLKQDLHAHEIIPLYDAS